MGVGVQLECFADLLWGRYGSAGNKDDVLDAFVLADVLRTTARKDLVDARVALTNQLLANLQHALPGAVRLFSRLDSAISIAWLGRFTTQAQVDWLSPKRFDAWLKTNSYCGCKTGQQLHDHLAAAPRGLTGPEADARATITLVLIDALGELNTKISVLERLSLSLG